MSCDYLLTVDGRSRTMPLISKSDFRFGPQLASDSIKLNLMFGTNRRSDRLFLAGHLLSALAVTPLELLGRALAKRVLKEGRSFERAQYILQKIENIIQITSSSAPPIE